MGTFMGHIIPGTAMLVYGLRWAYCIFYRYFLCTRELALSRSKARKYRSSMMFPFTCCPSLPLEPLIMVTAISVISIAEFITAFKYGFLQNGQHLTMYIILGLPACALLLKHYRVSILPGTEYVLFMLGLLINALLLYRHAHMKSPMEQQLHITLMYVFLVTVAVIGLELRHPRNPLVAVTRAYCGILSGTWLIQIAFVQYNPWGSPWPQDDHAYLLIATMSFAWHAGGSVLVCLALSCLAHSVVFKLSPAEVSFELDFQGLNKKKTLIKNGDCEQIEYLLENSDDDDI